MHLALVVDPTKVSQKSVIEAVRLARTDGKLDIILTHVPEKLEAFENVVRTLYEYTRSVDNPANTTVLPRYLKGIKYDEIYIQEGVDEEARSNFPPAKRFPAGPVSNLEVGEGSSTPSQNGFAAVAVGGTFDHLHIGHKLLLTLAGFLSRTRLIVGVTGPELLKNKKHAEAMDAYNVREAAVRNFVDYVFPGLDVYTEEINDIYGPTGTVENIDALVVSHETRSGGGMVNDYRESKGWKKLTIVEVGLIGGEAKVSSTDFRKRDLQAKA